MTTPLHEGQPWEETAQGGLNPSSHAAGEMTELVGIALAVIERAGQPMTPRSVGAVSSTLAAIVATVQAAQTGAVQRNLFSFGNIRKALSVALTTLPIAPLGESGSAEQMDAWVSQATKRTRSIVNAATDTWRLNESLDDRPWTRLFES